MNKLSLFLAILFLSASAFAVDGYQDIKFGISFDALKKMKKCVLALDNSTSTKYMKVYSCSNFKFGEKNLDAIFYFVDGKFLRVGFLVGDSNEDFLSYLDALTKKYGVPSLKADAAELQMFDSGKTDTIDFAWDNNTVGLRQNREGTQLLTLLLYTSPSYEPEMLKSKTKGVTDAL